MTEEIEEIMQRFTLLAEKISRANLYSGDIKRNVDDCQKSLIGKFIAEKQINFMAIKNFANQVWHFPKHITVVELGPNCFQFNLGSEIDMTRVLNSRPRVLDIQLSILHKWEPNIEKNVKLFKTSPF
ncbi:hypothetical protein ACH5RR_021102 [Cinchona calisaya]|uniref:DUF4283 domain-containing protein n=1 Tax=Cinchona calisaya TaxID=153742 RepID=A0ABD2ZHJ9_9GENT